MDNRSTRTYKMITDPQAIKFSNEQVRPLAEDFRALLARVTAAETSWNGGINAMNPNDPQELVNDGREAEGVSRLNGADINSFMSVILAMKAASNSEIIAKPCVRPLQAN